MEELLWAGERVGGQSHFSASCYGPQKSSDNDSFLTRSASVARLLMRAALRCDTAKILTLCALGR